VVIPFSASLLMNELRIILNKKQTFYLKILKIADFVQMLDIRAKKSSKQVSNIYIFAFLKV